MLPALAAGLVVAWIAMGGALWLLLDRVDAMDRAASARAAGARHGRDPRSRSS